MNKQDLRSAETRNRILEAAAGCFAESGYDGASVANICEAAGVSKGAFYHHFASKQELFLVLIDQWLEALDEQLGSLGSQGLDAPSQLLSMTGVIGQIIQLPSQQLLIYLEFLNRAFHDPAVLEATTQPFQRYRQQIASIIEVGYAEGTFHKSDAQTAGVVITALAVGLLIQGFLDPEGADWEQISINGMQLFLTGLQDRS